MGLKVVGFDVSFGLYALGLWYPLMVHGLRNMFLYRNTEDGSPD